MQHLANLPRVVDVERDEPGPYSPERVRLTFDNGYTASIVRGFGTYGNESGLYEMAVMHDGNLVYDTPVTDDVIGHVHSEQVPEICAQIAALPTRVSP